MTTASSPSLEEFLAAPIEQVQAVAPTTMFLAPGGTRREAALVGISPQSDEYPRWSHERMIECIDLLFRMGVRNLFLTALRYSPMSEVGRYRERLIAWTDECIAGPDVLADYARREWRVRLMGTESIPELKPTAERLLAATPARWNHSLWMYVSSTPEAYWTSVLAAVHRSGARTRGEIVRAFYGEDIPPATLCLSWGKPMIAADIMPLIVAEEMQCYWTQRPGFSQGEEIFRRIFYDYAYTRRTWRQDKSGRYADVLAHQAIWEQPLVLGLGQRVGVFWYPASINGVPAENLSI